jgi:hypothetical protein
MEGALAAASMQQIYKAFIFIPFANAIVWCATSTVLVMSAGVSSSSGLK